MNRLSVLLLLCQLILSQKHSNFCGNSSLQNIDKTKIFAKNNQEICEDGEVFIVRSNVLSADFEIEERCFDLIISK